MSERPSNGVGPARRLFAELFSQYLKDNPVRNNHTEYSNNSFAIKIKVSRTLVGYWCTAHCLPRSTALQKIIVAFFGDFAGYDDDKKKLEKAWERASIEPFPYRHGSGKFGKPHQKSSRAGKSENQVLSFAPASYEVEDATTGIPEVLVLSEPELNIAKAVNWSSNLSHNGNELNNFTEANLEVIQAAVRQIVGTYRDVVDKRFLILQGSLCFTDLFEMYACLERFVLRAPSSQLTLEFRETANQLGLLSIEGIRNSGSQDYKTKLTDRHKAAEMTLAMSGIRKSHNTASLDEALMHFVPDAVAIASNKSIIKRQKVFGPRTDSIKDFTIESDTLSQASFYYIRKGEIYEHLSHLQQLEKILLSVATGENYSSGGDVERKRAFESAGHLAKRRAIEASYSFWQTGSSADLAEFKKCQCLAMNFYEKAGLRLTYHSQAHLDCANAICQLKRGRFPEALNSLQIASNKYIITNDPYRQTIVAGAIGRSEDTEKDFVEGLLFSE